MKYKTGQPVDGPQFGVSPLPWDIPVPLPQRFSEKVEKVRVPHSSIVKVGAFFRDESQEGNSLQLTRVCVCVCVRSVTCAPAVGESSAPPAPVEAG